LADESIVSPLVKATLPVGLYNSVDSSLSKSLPVGLYKAIRLLGKEIMLYRLHRAGVKRAKAYAAKSGLKLNIGCGPNRKEGWVNIDLSPEAELALDMRERIPFPDGSAIIIYSEHFFDYLDYPEEAQHFLRESLRVLEPSGVFRVGVPDTHWPLLDYAGVGDGRWLQACYKSEDRWLPHPCKTPLDYVNYHFREGTRHRYSYDFETIENVLKEAGFVEINQCEFDPVIDTKNREFMTLYVNAQKPSAVL
jgi:predicted SAM-dependent methyltransferase